MVNENKPAIGGAGTSPGEPREAPASCGGHEGRDGGECGAALALGPPHDPCGTWCDQEAGHYPGSDHAGPHPLGTRPGDRVTWRGGGSVTGDPVPNQVTGTQRSNETLRRAAVAGSGDRPYMRDITNGVKGLSGRGYVVGELNTSYRDADGARVPGLERVPVRIRTPRRCDHSQTVCPECAESWMFDWVLYFDRTEGGRLLRAALGGDEALAAMARRRAGWGTGAGNEQP
jgi:hypothetical protein